MGRVHDKDVEEGESLAAEPPAPGPVGRVEVDSRGRNVWRWARDVIDSTSVLLKRLDNKDLALEPTQNVPIVRAADAASKGGVPNAKAVKGAGVKGMSKSKKATAEAEASQNGVFHPALQPDPGRDGGGGFDPYNSR
jgi:hypothetical protein